MKRHDFSMALLTLPLVIFIAFVFVWPVARFLTLGIDNSGIAQNLPRTIQSLSKWKPVDGVPGETSFTALIADLADAHAKQQDGILAQLINQRVVGSRILVIKTASASANGDFAKSPAKDTVLTAFPGWKNPDIWTVIAREKTNFTDYYLLNSLDLQRSTENNIEKVPPDNAVLLNVLGRTIWISLVVTALCALLSLPLAQAIVSAPAIWSRVIFALVLFPMWTSLLVRNIIWIIVLQKNGPINSSLISMGLISSPFEMIYTRFSLYVAMLQILLPIMVLSVTSVMKNIPPSYMKASLSLGAPWHTAWRRIQLPLILPGIFAGSAVVFVFSLGYYITPMLVGGPTDQMVSSYIAFYTNKTLNWGMSAALSIQLILILAISAVLFLSARAFFNRNTQT